MSLIDDRNKYSNDKITELIEKISKLQYIHKFDDSLCIYATGSFARGEASTYSDIDLFFISNGTEKIKNLDEIILKSDLIRITRDLHLPDFSGDGEYLTIHSLEDIIAKLGSPEDDYKNYFTARLLLLLESKVLFNKVLYDKVISKIVDVYFNDYHSHKDSFNPTFLANDIIRFWKTMCLNYEQKRQNSDDDIATKNKTRLKNLKLKFSRVTTCYSILCCLKVGDTMSPDDLKNLIAISPIDRLKYVLKSNVDTKDIIEKMLDLYEWFLEITGHKSEKVLKSISDESTHKVATIKAEQYHNLFYSLLELTSNDLLKYYTI